MVEDDASQLERMLGWLERPHWIVREAANGREALDSTARGKTRRDPARPYDPVMDGFQVVAALQGDKDWRDIPVIVITSLDLTAKDREPTQFRGAIRAGHGKLPTGRLGRAHPPPCAKQAGSHQRNGSGIVTKLLYVEDNDDNDYMLKMRLELLGDFEVVTAENGERGCEMSGGR